MYKVSLIIPYYNESDRITACLDALTKWSPPDMIRIREVIFVDDGSTDGSTTIVRRAIPAIRQNLKATVSILTNRVNRGKGYAVARGMLRSQGDYGLFLDADMSTPLSEVSKMVPAMKSGTDLIIGTRKNGHSTVGIHQPILRESMGHVFTFIANTLFRTRMTDFTCGFKAYSHRAIPVIFRHLIAHRWGFDVENIVAGHLHNLHITEVPVIWNDKRGSKVRMSTDVIHTLIELIHIRLTYRPLINPFDVPVIKRLAILADAVRTLIF